MFARRPGRSQPFSSPRHLSIERPHRCAAAGCRSGPVALTGKGVSAGRSAMKCPFAFFVLAAVGWLAAAGIARAQEQPRPGPTDYRALYQKREAMIPMRDGVRLYTAIYAPKDASQRHPILLTRTPYSSGPYGGGNFPGFFEHSWIPTFASFLRSGYIFVYQDVRGRWMSEGVFVN